jgi:Fe-S-cluster-containing dehydrogenase component
LDRKDVPSAEGYILVDTKKCQGCMTCMLACSLVHEGEENLSLSRMQVLQDPFGRFPFDITLERVKTCDLCLDTPFWKEEGGPDGKQACIVACPVGAIKFMKDLSAASGEAGYSINLRGKGWKKIGYPID